VALGVLQGRILADPVAESADQFGDGGLLVDAIGIGGGKGSSCERDLLGDQCGRDAGLVALG
jgi:hypothetical protein